MKQQAQLVRGRSWRWLAIAGAALAGSACWVGPNYKRPSAPVPAAYKEAPPESFKGAAEWQQAHPNEGVARGKWWEIFNDPDLNALEEQVSISNQNVLAAEAQFRAAADAVRIARAALFPVATSSPAVSRTRSSGSLFNVTAGNLTGGTRNTYNLPVDLSYQADLWGGIRRTVHGTSDTAQASFAQLENAQLSFQAQLAEDYFELHGTDGEKELLTKTVSSYADYLQLTKDRQASGVASGADVAQAETQLDTTQVQLTDLGVARAQFEHAIAILTGKPPSAVTIASSAIKSTPPPIPVGVPSTLLERRPDIAAAERQMAAANELIGIAQAAYYPSLTLTGSAGYESGSISKLIDAPSLVWSLGATLAETLYDAGKRHAQVAQARANYDVTVADYRQTVLTGLQQVEDNLAALRVLDQEARDASEAVRAANDSLEISTYQYKAGTVSYLQVITAQAAALQNQLSALNILTRRMTASVLLIEALGGGWDTSKVPSAESLEHGK